MTLDPLVFFQYLFRSRRFNSDSSRMTIELHLWGVLSRNGDPLV